LDVDALVSLGIYLEEHGQVRQAVNLYDRAIKAKPNCDLGYYFAGLAEERVSEEMASDAQQKMCKAVNLNAHLQTYPNVVAYFGQHPLPGARAASGPTPSPPTLSDLLAHGNQFVMGMGAGLLLAALLVYAVGRKRGASS
jgi:tetratricopeptide (TPR) repeat protein